MGTEFGSIVKGFVGDLEKRESLAKQAEKREKVVTYRCEASGIDMVITRVLNGKDTRTLGIILSQSDASGNPLVMMKEKDKVYEVSEKSLQSFFDGKDLDVHPVSTGCTAIPKIRKGKAFLDVLWSFIHSPNAVKLAKMGVLDTECILDMGSDRYGNNNRVWYVSSYGTFDDLFVSINKMKDENFVNVHQKLVKFAIAHMMKGFGYTYSTALKYLYSFGGNNDYYGYGYRRSNKGELDGGRKIVTNDSFKAFIVLANRYDEPFALKCMEEYYDDMNLLGLAGDKLYQLLAIPDDGRDISRSYQSMSLNSFSKITPCSLLTGRNELIEKTCVNFEKTRLWEYILNATCVGMGSRLGDYIGHWKDYVMMAVTIDKKVREKYPEHLQVAHDILVEKYDMVKDRIEENKLMEATEVSSLICDVNTMGYQFRVLRTPQAFCDEAAQNSNCVASYIARCTAGSTIVGSFRPKGEDSTLLTVEVSPETYRFIQIKGKFNRAATPKEMAELNKIQDKVLKRHEICKTLGVEELKSRDEKKKSSSTLDGFTTEEGETDDTGAQV